MDTIRGIDIIFTLDGTMVACADEADININVDMILARQPDSGKGKRFIPDKIKGTISISGVLTYPQRAHIYAPLDTFTKIAFNYHTADSDDGGFSGNCWVQSWGESSPSTSFAKYNASFIIDGLPVFTALEPELWEDDIGIILQDETPEDFNLG